MTEFAGHRREVYGLTARHLLHVLSKNTVSTWGGVTVAGQSEYHRKKLTTALCLHTRILCSSPLV